VLFAIGAGNYDDLDLNQLPAGLEECYPEPLGNHPTEDVYTLVKEAREQILQN